MLPREQGYLRRRQVATLVQRLVSQARSLLLRQTPATVLSSITDCKRYESLQRGRLFHSPFARLSRVGSSNSPCTDLPSTIRDVMKIELGSFITVTRAAAPAAANVVHSINDLHDIKRVVQDEICSALRSVSHVLLNITPVKSACSSKSAVHHEYLRGYAPLTSMDQQLGFIWALNTVITTSSNDGSRGNGTIRSTRMTKMLGRIITVMHMMSETSEEMRWVI